MPSDPQPDALLTLLAVARLGRYTAAAEVLGVNHSTVSRRLAALEADMGGRMLVRTNAGWQITALGRRALAAAETIEGTLRELGADTGRDSLQGMVRIAAPEGFTSSFLVPAMVELQCRHPELAVELLAATQRVRQNRSGVDVEVVVGRPAVHRAFATPVCDYSLRLYASPAYLARTGIPSSLAALAMHPVIYYIESSLQVDELDRAVQPLPASPPSIRSTSVFAHVEATAAGAGIGVLPDFMADHDARLVPVLRDAYAHPLSYWAVVRDEGPRNPAVAAAVTAIREHVRHAHESPADT
ncbi:LysR family transcriptional regulator [Microbacterium kribbense]|uniref:LysR family transcriptional regulator n=1 Tax=Microbacterium kribbense TaxID=433645 RepID=UPI0031D0C262